MQDTSVVGVLSVLHVELPIVRQYLSIAPEQRRRAAVEHTRDADHDLITEMLVDRRHLPREATEHEAVHESGAQLARAVILHAERRRHAALALDAVLERDAGEVAFQVVQFWRQMSPDTASLPVPMRSGRLRGRTLSSAI